MAVKRLRPYLLGRKFIVRTDHQALKWLNNCKDPSSRRIRWRLRFEEYEYEIEYTKGKDNTAVDSLSRIHAITRTEILDREFIIDDADKFREWKESENIPARLDIKPNDQTFYQITKEELEEYNEMKWLRKIYKILQRNTKIEIGDNFITAEDKLKLKVILLYYNDTYRIENQIAKFTTKL
jgi:hypothetical protein